jgi:predicted ATPase
MIPELELLVNDINQINRSDSLKKYIDFIHFPFYRNLQLNTRINFDFPLTVFVGPNGSGKSSTLHALYGAPEGQTPYDFWFDTAVDPVKYYNDEKKRHGFFYSYKNNNGIDLEVVKARIKRKDNPNYWETSRPLKWAGMKPLPKGAARERNPPIRKEVIYLDFRSELSAFDKYFYFREPTNLRSINRQEYLRLKSKQLKKVFDGDVDIVKSANNVKQNNPLEKLSKDELNLISFILGRNYEEGKIVDHKLFTDWGYSVRFKTDLITYSEAFAGSGEVAVVRLVREIHQAPKYSLILLDEPEVSLHPGAQHRLKLYLLDQIKRKKHQIIISTHSPTLIEELPPSAIKVFYQNPSSGRFKIDENRTYKEAFYHIGLPNPNKIEIIVEDVLSKKILEAVINSFDKGVASSFVVKFFPGGSTVLKTDFIKVYSQNPTISYPIVFDGDEKRTKHHFNPDSLPIIDRTSEKLEKCIKTQTGVKVSFQPDGNQDQANEKSKIDLMIQYLKYYEKFVHYLPGDQPEQIIWNSIYAENILGERDDKTKVINAIEGEKNYKSKFYLLKNALFDTEEKIDNLYSMFIKHWLNREGKGFQEIKELIERIRQN